MKILTVCFMSFIVFQPLLLLGATKAPEYEEIEFDALKIAPEKYKNKTVTFTETYNRYSATFPNYMERSGFKSEKYILIDIGEVKVPSIAKKDDAMTGFIATLEERSKVKVYGKIRKFRVMPGRGDIGLAPEYYVEVEKIELIEGPTKERGGPRDEELREKIEKFKEKEALKKAQERPPKHKF